MPATTSWSSAIRTSASSADYLDDIAAHLEDPAVGLVTHPLVGDGETESDARLGAIADNLHLTGVITPGVVAAKLFANKDYVIGKSMAMRRADLEVLGGFESVNNVLAEDFVLGRAVTELLGKRVVLGRSIVKCVSVRRALPGFTRRYARWNVMQHQCAGLLAYVGLLLENPTLLAAVAAALAPGVPTIAVAFGCAGSRMATDALAGQLLRGRAFRPAPFWSARSRTCCPARLGSTVSSAIRSNGARTASSC